MDPPPSDPQSRTVPVRDLVARPVSWLWPGRLALGKLSLLEGDPGLGKSLLALDLCARLSTGRPFPDGSPGPGLANSIVMSAEDGNEDTIRPRLEALGADLSRVFVFRTQDNGQSDILRLPSQTGFLKEALVETDARLVVIDPIVAFLESAINIYNDQSVRSALHPLAMMAESRRSVFKFIRHLNKTGEINSLYRGGGSIAFQAACRSAWLIGLDPAHPDRHVLAQVKNNLAPYQPSLLFQVVNRLPDPPQLTWLGETSLHAAQLLAGAHQRPPVGTRDFAADFLKQFLEAGPRTTREIWPVAQEQGLGCKRTLQRAAKTLDIRCIEINFDKQQHHYWLLPKQNLPDSIPPEARPPDLEPYLAPLREQFPPSTPLDDP